jgi:hypothetical protein
MSRTPRTIAVGIAAFAALAPAAVAMPTDGAIQTSSLAGTTSSRPALTSQQRQDLRSPDARDAATRPHLTGGHVALPAVHQTRIVHVDASRGFDVSDAALGAGGAFAAIVIAAAGGVALRRRSTTGHSLA